MDSCRCSATYVTNVSASVKSLKRDDLYTCLTKVLQEGILAKTWSEIGDKCKTSGQHKSVNSLHISISETSESMWDYDEIGLLLPIK